MLSIIAEYVLFESAAKSSLSSRYHSFDVSVYKEILPGVFWGAFIFCKLFVGPKKLFIDVAGTFIKLKCIPDYLLDNYLEFTPIDSTAKAILKIMKYTNKENCIYHIFNHNHVYLKDLLKMLNGSNFNINVISNDDFKKKIKEIIKNTNSDDLNTLINDLDKNLNLNYDSKIKLNSTHTIKILQLFGFEWPKIDKSYINNILKLIEGE